MRAVVIQDKDTAFAAVCSSVQAGYFDDPPHAQGLAHFLEHAVHLGSARFPGEGEYKHFLAQHGGSSNASTNMVHTQYHLTVVAPQLQGALARLGAALAAPLLAPESCMREVENVHAEYSRNTNSDARKLLQLRRSLGRPPYSQFSTGSLATLRDGPAEAGADAPALLRALWARAYVAPATTVAVVAPQEPEVVEAWVREAFEGLAAARPGGSGGGGGNDGNGSGAGGLAAAASEGEAADCGGGSAATAGDGEAAATAAAAASGASGRYGVLDVYGDEQEGALLRVCPSRDLRLLELSWFVPAGALAMGESKPWRLAGHVLGHEGRGSAAHLLKRQGLIQVCTRHHGRVCVRACTALPVLSSALCAPFRGSPVEPPPPPPPPPPTTTTKQRPPITITTTINIQRSTKHTSPSRPASARRCASAAASCSGG